MSHITVTRIAWVSAGSVVKNAEVQMRPAHGTCITSPPDLLSKTYDIILYYRRLAKMGV